MDGTVRIEGCGTAMRRWTQGEPSVPVSGNHDDRGSFLRHYLSIGPDDADLPFCSVHELPDVVA